MKIIFAILIATWMVSFRSGRQDDKCGVFTKNFEPQDTVTIKATYTGLVELPYGHSPLVYLERKKVLKARDFDSSIVFKIDSCDAEYNLVCGDNTFKGRKVFEGGLQQTVILTCVVFRDTKIPKYADEPFVIVTKVRKAE